MENFRKVGRVIERANLRGPISFGGFGLLALLGGIYMRGENSAYNGLALIGAALLGYGLYKGRQRFREYTTPTVKEPDFDGLEP